MESKKFLYTTTQGDAWDSIAYKLFGEERLAHELMRLNQEYMDVLVFPAGVQLSIPALERQKKKTELPLWM